LDAVGLLDIGGIYVYVGLKGPNEMAHGGGGSAGYFPLDIGGIGTCRSAGEYGLEIQGSELSCSWGVLGKLANLSATEVIASSADRSNLLTLAVSFSELFSLSEVSGYSFSDA
jgi:hypothetical protein